MNNKPIFKVHCSSIGKIMTNPRTKSEKLSKTCISHLEEWMKEQLYDRRINFRSKYTNKGNECEDASIEFASDYYGWGMVSKNTVTKEDDFIIGTCDVELSDTIVDIKNSWSQKTFPLFDTEIPADGYGWQGLGYLALYGKKRFQLTYTLMDAPGHLVEREARARAWDLGMEDVEAELYDEVLSEMTYSNLPDVIRIKSFYIDYDQDKVDAIKARVIECREYINQSGFYDLFELIR